MKTTLLIAVIGVLHAGAATAQTPSWLPPAQAERCPSKWGKEDERGSGNHIKPQTVLNAAKLIRTGEVIELGHELSGAMPIFPGRVFTMQVKRTVTVPRANKLNANEELLTAELGQVGTQFDGFAHIAHDNAYYNCFKGDEIATRTGFTKLGIQNVGMLMARGVLIDVAAFKGVDMLEDAYEITRADLEGAIRKQNLILQPGDAILIHTGWGKLYGKDNVRYGKSNPGLGIPAAKFLIDQDPLLLGADNTPVEVLPNPDPLLIYPVHQLALVVHGVHLLENLKLDDLVAKNVSEFAFVMQPLKLKGATGSTVAPAAVR